MNPLDFIELLTLIVLAVTLVCQVFAHRRVARYTLFAEYAKRYQEIALHLPENLNDVNTLDDDTKRYLRVYFDLCSEEYFLHKKKLLFKEVWNEWEEGMKFAFQNRAILNYWQEKKSTYEHFSKFIDGLLKEIENEKNK